MLVGETVAILSHLQHWASVSYNKLLSHINLIWLVFPQAVDSPAAAFPGFMVKLKLILCCLLT